MVQVDVFWSYGIGAGLGLAAGRQVLARREKPADAREADPYLMKTLLFLALVFAPSGLYLVWEFTSWETMHAGTRAMPAWLVCLFAITNVTQGLLAYVVVGRLLRAGRPYLAYLQVVAAYFAMFFVLVHGWDGKGYQRFFSPTHADFLAWNGDWSSWFTSDVALTLAAMGVVLVPLLVGMQVSWLREGYRLAGIEPLAPARIAALVLAPVFVGGLGLAVAAALLVNTLGAPLGVTVAIVVVAAALAPRGPLHALYRSLWRSSSTGVKPSDSAAPAASPRRAASADASARSASLG
jgi:hypothetical protein